MIRPHGISGVAFGTRADGDPRRDHGVQVDLSKSLNIPPNWAWVHQVHGASVVEPGGPGIAGDADALITSDPTLPIAVSVADCLPVALIAEGAIGLAHAGWRGASAGVASATAAALTERGHPPHTAVIGPGIGPCCFEVGEEVAARFQADRAHTSWGTPSIDLPRAVASSLDGLEVHVVPGCTHHEDRFHSYRADGTSRRQFGVAWVTAA